MRILFIQPAAGFLMRGTTYPVCRSIMVTSSYMKSIGHEVRVFDRCIDFSKEERVFDEFSPEAVVVYVPPTASIKDAIYLSELARKHSAFVVWCEVVAACFAEQIIESGHADFVITGETESKLRMLTEELKRAKNFSQIAGLTYKDGNKIISTENKNDTNLVEIPEIDWTLVDVEKCFRQFPHCKKMLYMYTSRGCPYKCTYCYNTMFYNSVHRKRPIKHVLNEIRFLEKEHGLDGVNFSDELLLLSDDEIKEIADFREENNLSFFWGGETRADTYKDKETLQKMFDAGCRWFLLGLETGSSATRKRINKNMDHALINDFVDRCTEVGITTFGSFIVGFPDETEEDLKATAEFAMSLNLDAFLFNYYIAIPKTPMCNQLIADGKIDMDETFRQSRTSHQIQNLTKNYSEIPSRDLLVVKSWFDWLTFTRKKKEASEKNMFFKKALDTFKHFAKDNLKDSVTNIFNSGKTFLTVVFYSFAFPKIKKKYNLRNINKTK